VAGAALQQPKRGRGRPPTDNAAEAVAAAHCDLMLCLDEMGECPPEVVSALAYMLANGTGKGRAGRDGSGRRVPEWRLLFLSTGEVGLADLLAEARGGPRRPRAGQEVRVVDIPADAGAGLGLFEDLHGERDGAALADRISTAARRLYGTAGQVQRVAGRFALLAAAGEMATALGILPFLQGEAEGAAARCFTDWLAAREGGAGAAEDAKAIAAVRRFLIAHGASRFETVKDQGEAPDEQRIALRAGWRKRDGSRGWRFLIPGEVWRNEVVPGLDAQAAAVALRREGYLIPQTERAPKHVRDEWINGRSMKVYCISDRILEGDGV
jgi:putative DNA primase/helicase